MRDGILYVFLGIFWLIMVAITGNRRTLSTYIYTLIGAGGLCFGVIEMLQNASAVLLIAATVFITALVCTLIFVCVYRHRNRVNANLSDNSVPEPSAEEKFIRKYNKETYGEQADEEMPIR